MSDHGLLLALKLAREKMEPILDYFGQRQEVSDGDEGRQIANEELRRMMDAEQVAATLDRCILHLASVQTPEPVAGREVGEGAAGAATQPPAPVEARIGGRPGAAGGVAGYVDVGLGFPVPYVEKTLDELRALGVEMIPSDICGGAHPSGVHPHACE